MSFWGHVRAIILLPFMVLVVIPGTILFFTNSHNLFWGAQSHYKILLAVASTIFLVSGLLLLVSTISLFARKGAGTLAPWDSTEKLVTDGVYGHVRNPMLLGVFCVLVGEALVFGSVALVVYDLFFIIGNLVYVPLVEEPGLVERFGEEYVEYRENVPSWIPRRERWDPD